MRILAKSNLKRAVQIEEIIETYTANEDNEQKIYIKDHVYKKMKLKISFLIKLLKKKLIICKKSSATSKNSTIT